MDQRTPRPPHDSPNEKHLSTRTHVDTPRPISAGARQLYEAIARIARNRAGSSDSCRTGSTFNACSAEPSDRQGHLHDSLSAARGPLPADAVPELELSGREIATTHQTGIFARRRAVEGAGVGQMDRAATGEPLDEDLLSVQG